MAFVVAEPCIKCKYTDCVDVCPVDCFHETENMLVIDPDECIDCGACEPECPTTAIFSEDDLPENWAEYQEINAKLSTLKKGDGEALWPVITKKKDPAPDADNFKDEKEKKKYLTEWPA